uniref:Uncharacterized protein n=1 Tax=Romanomermis culicivorax TaxID=13658 RepID=A0A915KYH7_ROMCU
MKCKSWIKISARFGLKYSIDKDVNLVKFRKLINMGVCSVSVLRHSTNVKLVRLNPTFVNDETFKFKSLPKIRKFIHFKICKLIVWEPCKRAKRSETMAKKSAAITFRCCCRCQTAKS